MGGAIYTALFRGVKQWGLYRGIPCGLLVGTVSGAYMILGANDPCPCGSGNKFKRCCGKKRSPATLSRWHNVKQIYAAVLELNDVSNAVEDVAAKISIVAEAVDNTR